MAAKLRIVLWIGIVLFFLPLFGIPTLWKNGITIILGALVIYLVFRLKYAYKKLRFEHRDDVPVSPTIHG